MLVSVQGVGDLCRRRVHEAVDKDVSAETSCGVIRSVSALVEASWN
jgi:hypothetical protein